ncbi:MAG: phage holin family protein [Thermoanaerobaculia bacterium]
MSSIHDARERESLGRLIRGLLEDVSTLFRSEIALAKVEIRQAIAGLGGVAAMFAAALLFALIGLAFVFVTLVLLLALVMPAWVATLLVALVLFGLAGTAAWVAYRKLRATEFAPMEAIDGIRRDVDMIRSELRRVREGESDEQ